MTDTVQNALADLADRGDYWFELAMEDAFLDMLEEEQEQEGTKDYHL
jgi:hypothetical protein